MTQTQKNIEIKDKLINHFISNGKKRKSEKIVWKNIKTLQIISKKSSKKLVQLALLSTAPLFKINTIIKKKKKKKKQKPKLIPAFRFNKISRISFAIKFIITTIKKNHQRFSEEILLSSNKASNAIEIKQDTQKQVFLNRHLFKYYRWH